MTKKEFDDRIKQSIHIVPGQSFTWRGSIGERIWIYLVEFDELVEYETSYNETHYKRPQD